MKKVFFLNLIFQCFLLSGLPQQSALAQTQENEVPEKDWTSLKEHLDLIRTGKLNIPEKINSLGQNIPDRYHWTQNPHMRSNINKNVIEPSQYLTSFNHEAFPQTTNDQLNFNDAPLITLTTDESLVTTNASPDSPFLTLKEKVGRERRLLKIITGQETLNPGPWTQLKAVGVEQKKGGLETLFTIMAEGMIFSKYSGQLLFGDPQFSAGHHGPYWVILTEHDKKQQAHQSPYGFGFFNPTHVAYVVPNLADKYYLDENLDIFEQKNVLSSEVVQDLKNKILTYDDFLYIAYSFPTLMHSGNNLREILSILNAEGPGNLAQAQALLRLPHAKEPSLSRVGSNFSQNSEGSSLCSENVSRLDSRRSLSDFFKFMKKEPHQIEGAPLGLPFRKVSSLRPIDPTKLSRFIEGDYSLSFERGIARYDSRGSLSDLSQSEEAEEWK
jgi:hypothetical protein